MKKLFAFLVLTVLICGVSQAEVIDKVIVVVNDEVITQREFDRMYIPMMRNFEANYKGEDKQQRLDEMREAVLDQIIDMKLTVSIARKSKIEVDQEELQERIDTVKGYFGNDQAFLQALSERGTNLTEFKKEIEEQMMAQKLVQKEVSSKIVITPAMINDLYEKNKEVLKTPKRARVSEIMVRKDDDPQAAKKKINNIYTRLRKGEDFAAIARKESQGPYASQGGDMGFVGQGDLITEIDTAIFSTPQGNMTGVIETETGYHVLRVEEIEESRDLSLDEVNDFLKNQLFQRKFAEDLKSWLDEKRKDAYISYK